MASAFRGKRVVVVAQAFKGTLSATEVAESARIGVESTGAECRVVVASDGGDGFLEVLRSVFVRTEMIGVTGPFGEQLEIPIGWLDEGVAVVQSGLACGLGLVRQGEGGPITASTLGVGEAIVLATRLGASDVIVGLGGSGTVDGGWGAGVAAGYEFVSADGSLLQPGIATLAEVRAISIPAQPIDCRVIALCDVSVPLTGSRGAVLFAPQKGVPVEKFATLMTNFERLAGMVPEGLALASMPGAGAAGGLGFGLAAFFGADLISGSEWILERLAFDRTISDADVVVVLEGGFDATSVLGKLSGTVLGKAARRSVVTAIVAPHINTRTVPGHVTATETGGGVWSAADVTDKTASAVRRCLALLGP